MENDSEKNKEEEIEIRKLEPNQISEKDEFINFKTIIVGNSGVGKSSLLKRAVQRKFTDHYQATIGFEFLLLYYEINGVKIKLQIWDTCGEEMYRSLVQGFYRNTSLTLLVYSISDQKSFDDLYEWLNDIKKNTEKNMPIFLVGTKYDLNDDLKIIKKEDALNFVKSKNLQYFSESSAKTGYQVDEIFNEIARYLYFVMSTVKFSNWGRSGAVLVKAVREDGSCCFFFESLILLRI